MVLRSAWVCVFGGIRVAVGVWLGYCVVEHWGRERDQTGPDEQTQQIGGRPVVAGERGLAGGAERGTPGLLSPGSLWPGLQYPGSPSRCCGGRARGRAGGRDSLAWLPLTPVLQGILPPSSTHDYLGTGRHWVLGGCRANARGRWPGIHPTLTPYTRPQPWRARVHIFSILVK